MHSFRENKYKVLQFLTAYVQCFQYLLHKDLETPPLIQMTLLQPLSCKLLWLLIPNLYRLHDYKLLFFSFNKNWSAWKCSCPPDLMELHPTCLIMEFLKQCQFWFPPLNKLSAFFFSYTKPLLHDCWLVARERNMF